MINPKLFFRQTKNEIVKCPHGEVLTFTLFYSILNQAILMPALAIAIISRNRGVFIKQELLCERREWKKLSHKSRITPLQGVKEYSHSYRLP